MRAENGILHSRMNLFHVIGLPLNIEVAVESTPENSAMGKLTNQRSRRQRSFSKNAGFTGLRYSYTVVPKSLKMCASNEEMISLHGLWNRRQSTKFNRTAYIVQRAAEAVYSPQGQQEIREMVVYYMHNAGIIGEGLIGRGRTVFGGENAPYIWLQCPVVLDSWTFFDRLLEECHIVGTSGIGFGTNGEGYFLFTESGSGKPRQKETSYGFTLCRRCSFARFTPSVE